jgi:sucrose-6-phosphate hydrolase SacC (GH32 family)
MKKWVFVLLTVLIGSLACATEPTYNEQYRPQFHFTPPSNWMNDPNGLVYLDGEYHLFYQHNPFGNRWGHISWGHAISQDLVHWEHLPIAIPEENGVMAFSGSAIVDATNTSGFGNPGHPPLVAVYTSYRSADRNQAQYLAYSLDHGRTWKHYSGNPVLDIKSTDFRDPKVFWYEPDQRWIMVLVLAAERKVSIYGSQDLKQWTHLSDFGPAGAIGGAWECPDLFPLEVEGSSGLSKWVLQVDLDRRAVAGGSGGQYFIGSFDGERFLQDKPAEDFSLSQKGEVLATFDESLPTGWKREGKAFEIAPSSSVTGALGPGVLHSGRSGEDTTGSVTSAPFPLKQWDYLSFLVGGGRNKEKLAVELIVGNQVVRHTSAYNGDVLDWISWDIRPFHERSGVLRVTDQSTENYWGHLVVDHIVLSDEPALPSVYRGRWVDYGMDFYAVTSWSGIPTRRIWLAWMNNWLYAEDIPTAPWRSAMTIPRELRLRSEEGSLQLVQTPIRELRKLQKDHVQIAATTVNSEKVLEQINGNQLELEATFEVCSAQEVGLIVHRANGGQGTVIGYDIRQGQLFVDRRGAGQEDFNSAYSTRSSGPLAAPHGRVKLHIFVDHSSVEVFGNDGETVLTTRVFPEHGSLGVALFANNGDARLLTLDAWKLRSIWAR